MSLSIREATPEDFEAIWPIFHAVVSTGETYAYDRETSKEEARRLWMYTPEATFVAEMDGRIVGSYYIKTNQPGPGNHVCNCGYMVAEEDSGQGVATAMCEDSQRMARQMGYQAMQFNLVLETNMVALRLWQRLGFETVGRLPGAFRHPSLGYVDALVMYKWLAPLTS